MKYKYCKKRRLFLANASRSIGLVTASNLFSLKAFSNTAKPKKNIVSIFFLHTGNIENSEDKGWTRGSFHFGKGSSLSKLNQVRDQAVFFRGVDQGVGGNNRGGRQHDDNAGAVFTAHLVPNSSGQVQDLVPGDNDSGNSIDILIGKYLQKKYPETKVPYALCSLGNRTGSGEEDNGKIRYRTSSIERLDGNTTTVRNPIINPNDFYEEIKKAENCAANQTSNNNNTNSNQQQIDLLVRENKKLQITLDNVGDFNSNYLIPKVEFEKLNGSVAKKIERNLATIKTLESGGTVVPIDCGDIPRPNRAHNFNNEKGASYDKVRKHCQAHSDLIAYSFKHNHTRSATIYPGDWSSDRTTAMKKYPGNRTKLNSMHGSAGHGYINNPMTMLYHERLSEVINDLVNSLKKAGVYEDTMIIVSGEFSDQNGTTDDSKGGGGNHRSDNMPWLVINSGAKAQDHNFGTKQMIHIGDVHLAIMHRMGMTHKKVWGTKNFGTNRQLDKSYQTGKRRGDTRLVSVLNT